MNPWHLYPIYTSMVCISIGRFGNNIECKYGDRRKVGVYFMTQQAEGILLEKSHRLYRYLDITLDLLLWYDY